MTGPTSVTVDPSGKFAYAANTNGTISAYTIDQITGALTDLGTPVSAGTYPTSVTVDPSGKFAYAADTIGGTIYSYTIDSTTGTLTALGTAVSAGTYPTSVTVDQSGQFVYVANMGDNTISAYTIINYGTLTELGNGPFQPVRILLPSSRFSWISRICLRDKFERSTISAYTMIRPPGH